MSVQSPENDLHSFWYGVANPEWIPLKASFLVIGATFASCFPFIVPFYKQTLGLTVAQVGILEFVIIVVGVVSTPIIGTIADKSGRRNLVVALCIVFFTIPITSLALISPPTKESHPVTLLVGQNGTYELEVCGTKAVEHLSNMTSLFVSSKSNSTIDQLVCRDLDTNTTVDLGLQSERSLCSIFHLGLNMFSGEDLKCTVEFRIENSDNSWIFLWVCLARGVASLTLTPSIAILDSIAYDMITSEHRGLWGQQRMFASLGFALSSGIMGVVLNHFNTFRISFITFGILSSLAVCITFFWLPKRLHSANKKEDHVPFCKAISTVLESPIFCITCIIAIATGMFASIMGVVWPQHLTELGASKLEFGMIPLFVCITEIPFFFFAGVIIDHIGEPICLLLSFVFYIFRFWINAFLTPETVWLALPVEAVTHVFCYVLFFSSATRIGATIAPPGTTSSVQAAIATSFGGIGTGSGVLFVSYIYASYGGFYAFLIYASFAFLAFLFLLIVYFAYFRNAMIHFGKLRKASEVEEKEDESSSTTPLLSHNNSVKKLEK